MPHVPPTDTTEPEMVVPLAAQGFSAASPAVPLKLRPMFVSLRPEIVPLVAAKAGSEMAGIIDRSSNAASISEEKRFITLLSMWFISLFFYFLI